MKKILSIILSTILSMAILFSATGCMQEKPPEYESEYFKYLLLTNKDGSQVALLTGFTELGQQQKELILPEYIEGIHVEGMGYERCTGWFSYLKIGKFESENLKRLYIPYSLDDWDISGWSGGGATIYIAGRVVQWKGSWIWNKGGSRKIIGYNILNACFNQMINSSFDKLVSNVAYMVNYEVDGDDSYYWVDSYDNDIITFIPPAPTRKGYAFKGWYKETECINEWDFATDKTGDEIPIIKDSKVEDYDDSGITYLYAKWERE